jgi:hypothetical protein
MSNVNCGYVPVLYISYPNNVRNYSVRRSTECTCSLLIWETCCNGERVLDIELASEYFSQERFDRSTGPAPDVIDRLQF